MKLLALGDTQIGVGTVDLADQEAVLNRIVDVALERNVDLVLHGGDVFEGPLVTPEQLRVVLDALRRLVVAEVPVLMLSGNGKHDMAMRSVNGLDVFRDVPGISVASRPAVEYVAGVAVCCLPWVSPARLVAEHDVVVDRDRVNEYAAELLVKIAGEMFHEAAKAHPNRPRVLLAHWAISGSSLPTGLPVDQLREPVLEWEALDEIGFDCIAASHIHQHQWLGPYSSPKPAPTAFYTGSPQPLNHGEEKDTHGCYLVDLEETVTCEFIEIASRPFLTLDADLTEDTSGLAYVDVGLKAEDQQRLLSAGAIVRCRIRASEEQWRRVNTGAIRDGLVGMGASKVTFEPEIARAERARVAGVTESLGVDEALRAYCEAQGVEGPMVELMSERLVSWRS